MKEPLPLLASDEAAERFVDEADLSDYDLSGGRKMRFVFADETTTPVTPPRADLEAAIRQAEAEGLALDAYLGRLVHDRLEQIA